MSSLETTKEMGRRCKHYKGWRADLRDMCAEGLDPVEVSTGGELKGWLKKAPCIERNENTNICDKRVFPTWDEVEKESLEMDKAIENILTIVALIPKKGNQGTVKCPKCENVVDWTRAEYNGHRWAKCRTKDCLSFIE